ncbi:MAG TPA: hypothetical protein VIM33_07555 [Gaiellaceae bacterium]
MASDPRFPRRPLYGCSGCHLDFSSVGAFDAHRVGKYDQVFGVEHLNGRLCLDVEEMAAKGFRQNSRGRWSNRPPRDELTFPVQRAAASGRFPAVGVTPERARGDSDEPQAEAA